MAELTYDQARNRLEVVGLDLLVVKQLDFPDFRARINQVRAVIGSHYRIGSRLVQVFDLAEYLLDYVFDGDETGHAAVFIDDHRDLNLCLLHILERRANRLALGNKVRGPHALSHRRIRLLRFTGRKQISDIDHALDGVDLIAVNRYARVLRLDDQLTSIGNGGGRLDRHNLGSRPHYLGNACIAELDEDRKSTRL